MARSEQTPEERAAHTEKRMARIEELLAKLKFFETDRPYGNSDIVDSALGMIREEFGNHPEWRPEGAVLILHGSLQYHDYHHLDIDLVWATERKNNRFRDIQYSFQTEFEGRSNWPGPERCDTNILFISLEEIEKDAPEYTRSQDDYNFSPMEAGFILSSQLLFDTPDQRAALADMQAHVRAAAQQHPAFREGIIHELNETVRIRKERRKERKRELGIRPARRTRPQ